MQNVTEGQVPQLDFATLKYLKPMSVDGDSGVNGVQTNGYKQYTFNGASYPVARIAEAVARLGQILPITPPAPNSTWTIDFWGPALDCHGVPDAESEYIWLDVWNGMATSGADAYCAGGYTYLSWSPYNPSSGIPVPVYNGVDSAIAPFQPVGAHVMTLSNDVINYQQLTIDGNLTGRPMQLFVSILPAMSQLTMGEGQTYDEPRIFGFRGDAACEIEIVDSAHAPTPDYAPPICYYMQTSNLDHYLNCSTAHRNLHYAPREFYANATLLQCDVLNTSYSMDFSYVDGVQNVTAHRNQTGSSPAVNAFADFAGPEYAGCPTLGTNSPEDPTRISTNCTVDPATARQLSYQAIAYAFNDIVRGSASFS